MIIPFSRAGLFVPAMVLLLLSACGPQKKDPPEPVLDSPAAAKQKQTEPEAAKKGTDAKGKDGEPPKDEPRPEVKNVLLVIVDALRADRVGAYGYDKPTTPTADALAEEGILFEQFHAASPWTAPAFGSIFTGVSPTVHGAGDILSRQSSKGARVHGVTVDGLRKDLPTLAELLPDDVEVSALVTNSFLTDKLGFGRGFDHYDHKNAAMRSYRTADEVTETANAWLEKNHGKRFFLVVHYFDPHMQYGPPDEYVEKFAPKKPRRIPVPFTDHASARSGKLDPSPEEAAFIKGLYDGEVRFADDELKKLLGGMKEMGVYDDTWIVFTSDHGEEHFEHGSFDHGHRYEEEVVRVPLIVRAPGGKWRAGHRVRYNASQVDLLPTFLDLYDLQVPAHLEGKSLMPLVSGAEKAHRASYMEYNLFNGQQCALFDGRHKIVWDVRKRSGFLYDLEEDPAEKNKLGSGHPAYKAMLEALQKGRKARAEAAKGKVVNRVELGEEASKALESLGYIE